MQRRCTTSFWVPANNDFKRAVLVGTPEHLRLLYANSLAIPQTMQDMPNIFRLNVELQGTHNITFNATKFTFNAHKFNNFRQNFKPRCLKKTQYARATKRQPFRPTNQEIHSFHQMEIKHFLDTHQKV